MSTVPPASHRSHRARRRGRSLAAGAAAVALSLVSVVAVAWPGAAQATGSGSGSTEVEIVKTAVQDGTEIDVTSPLLPGDAFDYVLNVTSTGTAKAREVTVTDDLPSTVEPAGAVTVTDDGTVVGTTPGADPVEVELGTLLAGETRVVTIPVRVVDGARGCSTFSNSASATYVHGYGEHHSSESNEVTLAVGCVDLTIDKVVADDGPVAIGDEVTFDISVSLADVAHPVPVRPVVVTDDLDETRFAFVAATDGGSYAAGVVTWTLAAGLAPGDPPVTVSLTVRLLEPGTGGSTDYTNTACVALTPGDDTPVIRPGDDCDDATVSTGSIDLSLDKRVNGLAEVEVGVGDLVTYTLTVANDGPADATGVVVEDALPAAVTFVEQTGGDGALSADGATWTVGDVPADDSASVTFTATVDEPGRHTNVAEITEVDQTDTDSTPGNGCTGVPGKEDDCAEATVVASETEGSLALVKTNAPTGTLDGYLDASGSPRTIEYALTVTAGPGADQSAVRVLDTVPAGTALVPGSAGCDGGPAGCATVDGSDIAWAVGDLGAGTSATVRFTVALLPPTGPVADGGTYTIRNSGVAVSTTDRTPSNEVENDVTVRPPAPLPLTVVKSNDPTGVVAFGTTITYTLAVAAPGTGPGPHTGVVVTDTIPGYQADQSTSGTATYVDGSATCVPFPPVSGTCDVTEITNGTATTGLSWALGTMSPGETRVVEFQVTVEKQDAVVEGSETVDFVNVAAVWTDTQPSTPSNEVVNTAVITEVSDENLDNGDLPATGSSVPIARLAVFGSLLVALGAVLVRQPTLVPARRPRGRHAAR